jgi:hypothetical protein
MTPDYKHWGRAPPSPGGTAKASPSFLKKRSKKLLIRFAPAPQDRASPDSQKFFGSFSQKRTASCLHPIARVRQP